MNDTPDTTRKLIAEHMPQLHGALMRTLDAEADFGRAHLGRIAVALEKASYALNDALRIIRTMEAACMPAREQA